MDKFLAWLRDNYQNVLGLMSIIGLSFAAGFKLGGIMKHLGDSKDHQRDIEKYQDAHTEKDAAIDLLQRQLDDLNSVILVHGSFLFLRSDFDSKSSGLRYPICPICRNNGNIVRMHFQKRFEYHKACFHCKSCNYYSSPSDDDNLATSIHAECVKLIESESDTSS